MKTLPYFKWYPADAEIDGNYAAMDDSELGFYHRCLNRAWRNGGLPADATERARVLGKSKAYSDKKWERVGKCFEVSESNPLMVVNPRQEKERLEAIQKSERATNSVRTRYERSTNEVPRAFTRAESESVFDFDSKKKTSLLDDFHNFLSAAQSAGIVGAPTDFNEANEVWKFLDFEQKSFAVKGLEERAKAGEYNDPSFRPLPQNYLRKKLWLRPIRASPLTALEKRDQRDRELAKRLGMS